MKRSTINWRVYDLVQQGILERIGRGKFKLGEEKNFKPELSAFLKNIFQAIREKAPFLEVCIWNTASLNEFMRHQPSRFFTLVEVDREGTESLTNFLMDQGYPAFPANRIKQLNNYLLNLKSNVLLVRPLVTEAPLQSVDEFTTPTLEKILVDLFCDDELFAPYQGAELTTIFKTAFEKYTIHENKMLRYARRREKKQAIKQYLEKNKLLAVNR